MKKKPLPRHLRSELFLKGLVFFYACGFALALVGFARIMSRSPVESSAGSVVNRVERGSIYDRNGRLLASQVKRQSLEAWPKDTQDPERVARRLAKILQMEPERLVERFVQPKRDYFWVKRFLSDRETTMVRRLIDEENVQGLRFWPEYSRVYPQVSLASHLIGFANIDGVGLDGVEMSMDAWLLSVGDRNQAVRSHVAYGDDVYLTIDIETQYLVDKITRQALQQHQADNLIALLMDAKNGDILAYVSQPEYNPSLFNRYDEQLRRNIPIASVYEPGSVFKIFPMAIYLDEGLASLDEVLSIGTTYYPEQFRQYRIPPIADVTKHGALSLTEVLIYSSNVGMATLSERIASDLLYRRITDFGFGRVTGIPLPGESSGLLKAPEFWSLRSKPTIVFGQELAVTSLQLVAAATALTNGGVRLAPQIISRVIRHNGAEVLSSSRQPIKEVISPATASTVLLMMEQVVSSPFGTMREAQVDGMSISGKSGTAQVFDPATGRYDPTQVNGSILAIFPTDDPQFILYISMLNPKGRIRYGGRIASPVAREVILALTNRYHLPLAGNRIAQHSGQLASVTLRPPQKPVVGATLPSLLGLSKKELLPLLLDERLQLHLEGNGRVVQQDPSPGTPVPPQGLSLRVWLQ